MARLRGPKVTGALAALLALGLFLGLGALPWLGKHHGISPWVRAAQASVPVKLATTPTALPAVALAASAQPVDPNGPHGVSAPIDPAHQAALVVAEDHRLRTLLHHSTRLSVATVVSVRGGLPTLVLPPRPAPYSAADLESAGALVPLRSQDGELLVDSVLITNGAVLDLGGTSLKSLLLNSSAEGFTSIVSWGGTLTLHGTSASPLNVTGWDQVTAKPAPDQGYGRPYIRAVGGRMQLDYVNASSLGFWSGRTGGVAWTGISSQASSGGASNSKFTGDTYGAFVSRTQDMKFTGDLFEMNELDGLRLHRGSIGSAVIGSAAARNGGNGFVIDRGATNDVLSGDVAVNNSGNGFLLDGRALVHGASPSGVKASDSGGTVLRDSEARGNTKSGILVEGGTGPVVQRNIVCSANAAIALRNGATGTVVTGNDVQCGGRVALSIGPGVNGTTVTGNNLSAGRIGVLVHNASGVRLLNNTISGMSVFGLSVRGASPGVVGDSNAISGRGFRAIDVRAGAGQPSLSNTDSSGWSHQSHLTVWAYLRYHPILLLWVCIISVVVFASVLARLRRHRRRAELYAHRFGQQVTHGHSAPQHAALHPATFGSATPAMATAGSGGHDSRASGATS